MAVNGKSALKGTVVSVQLILTVSDYGAVCGGSVVGSSYLWVGGCSVHARRAAVGMTSVARWTVGRRDIRAES
jgi:hypothetical protein